MRKLTAILRKEDNMFISFCPELGVTSQGKTQKKAVENLKEASELYLEEFPENDTLQLSFEVAAHVKA